MKLRLAVLGVVAVALVALCLPAVAQAYFSTADGAWVWQNPVPQGNVLYDVCFLDTTHGWAVGQLGVVLKTSDGGATWSVPKSPTAKNLTSVAFVSAERGWIVGSDAGVFETKDGGRTRAAVPGLAATQVEFVDSTHGWLLQGNRVYRTVDGGVAWAETDLLTMRMNAMDFVDADHGWVVGDGGVQITTDGGQTGGRRRHQLTRRQDPVGGEFRRR